MVRLVIHGLVATAFCAGSISLAAADDLAPRAVDRPAVQRAAAHPDRGSRYRRRYWGFGPERAWRPPGGVYYADPFFPFFDRPGYFRDYTYFYFGPWYPPAEVLYGPSVVGRFPGEVPLPAPPRGEAAQAPRAGDDPLPETIPTPAPKSNERAIALGRRFIAFGDAHVREGRVADAYRRYKKAAQAAPGLAQAYFRQGIALMAVGNYHLAADVLKKGLRYDPDWAQSGFQLDDLYGQHQAEKAAHIEALAQAADKDERNGKLLFLLGVYLHFDGQPDRARLFFEQARQLGPDRWHLAGFLHEPHQAEL